MEQFNVDLTAEELARVDALIPACSTAEHPATRTDVLRMLVNAGLDAMEKAPSAPRSPES